MQRATGGEGFVIAQQPSIYKTQIVALTKEMAIHARLHQLPCTLRKDQSI